MANYPTADPSFGTKTSGLVIDASHVNSLQDEVVAIGSALRGTLAHALTVNGQIVFPAAQNASAGANTLDDYEEGTYVPTWTSGGSAPSLGNGSINGSYIKIGQFCWVSVVLIGGTTTTWGNNSNAWTISLPFTAGGISAFGMGIANDTGTANYPCIAAVASGGTTVTFTKTSTVVTGNFTSDEPFTWGTGDNLSFTIVYRTSA